MKSKHTTRSVSRFLALGLLSVPMFVAGGCGGDQNGVGNGASLTGGSTSCTGTDCVATGGVGNGTGGSTGTGASVGTGGAVTGTGGTTTGTGGTVTGTGGTTTTTCVDTPPPYDANWPDATCEKWASETSECSAEWFAGYCDVSCGRCQAGSGGSTSTGGTSSGGTSSGGTTSTGGQGGGPTLPNLPDSAKKGWASRYWDCCKPSCAWDGQVDSCSSNGTSTVDKNQQSACSGGSAYVCNSDAPRALSSTVSYGYVAQPSGSLQCGVCYHLQFTGESKNGTPAPALAGKHMIVKVSNNGGDVQADQLDLMIPGGGTGVNPNTCPTQWGKSSSDMGAQYGGFRTTCNGDKTCIKQKCNSVVPAGTLRDSCNWYVDWFEAADNPVFKMEQINCPSDI